ncbi:multiple sugar transport system permease protein [Friedmanniella endophytica]|uniref:Multiple sugar transport system permease protein n=1 Tax=Microlunatus kandeliicorticis TaxID=1759536 RepID=A0A7W3IRZ8_9ACTN|nr:sugar ABC transporter permease [Microlunatus kandeliicorticis]MBA8794171.1 multiple sugar transport system permease protein [Microlunatus kandeliicorticis]
MTASTLERPTAPVARPSAREESDVRRGEARPAWLFIAPFGIFYVLFLIWPIIYMLISSFFNTSLVAKGFGSFAGFGNYAEMLTLPLFWESMWHTIFFTIITTIPLVVLAFVFAILANRVRRAQWFFRLAFFVPFILPSAAIAIVWTFIYSPSTGLWDSLRTALGNPAPNPVLGTPDLALIGVAVTTIWWTIGFNFVLYLAGLQDIPRELYEAAAVDGASQWQQIKSITIPLLGRTTTLVVLLQIIASLKIFDQVYLMTAGGPGTSSQVVLGLVTDTAFTNYRVGAGSAASVLLLIVILIVTGIRQLIERAQNRRAA